MSEIKISLFKPGRNGKTGVKPHPTDFYTEMSKIKDGTHYPVIKRLREITDPVEKRAYKVSKLEGFTISAFCPKYRETKGAIPSGLMAIDIDPGRNPTIEDWGEVRDMLFEMPEVVAAFLSASGNGVAFVVKINPKKFKDVFYSIKDELYDNFGLTLDPGCHDMVRLRFASHDHDACIRENFEEIPVKEPSSAYLLNKKAKDERVIEYTGEVGDANCDRAWSYAVKAAEQKVGQFGDGSKHSYLVALAGFCNTIGMNLTYCESMVQKHYSALTDISIERLLKPVQNVYRAYPHKFDTYVKTVESRRLNSKIVGDVVNNYIRKGVKPEDIPLGDIAERLEANIERVEEVVERVIHEYREEQNADAKEENKGLFKQFWYVDEENKVNISKMAFRDFLTANGVYRLEIEEGWLLVRIQNNIVERLQRAQLKHIVMNYIEKMKEFEVWETLANRVGSVFADEYLELIPVKEIQFYRDSKEFINLFFLNGVVRISETSIELIDWKDFDGLVWKSKVIKRNIELNEDYETPIPSDFVTFLTNITKNDDNRFKSIVTSIGYLLHGYKDKSLLPVIILNDEVISDIPQGGTGKGMIVDAIKRFKQVSVIDGKLFKFDDQFRYQTVTLETDIIFFDDVKEKFAFENLFSSLTEGLDVERKGQLKFKLPFEVSPKMIISTNYGVGGEGNSNERRKNDIEIGQFYTRKFTPKDEFKKLLFDDFNEEEYNNFDNFIVRCCLVYLREGLVEQKLINQPLKQLYASVSHEFVTFMEQEYEGLTAESNIKINKVELYHRYMKIYPGKLAAKTFYGNVERYLDYHGILYVQERVFDNYYYKIGNGGELF